MMIWMTMTVLSTAGSRPPAGLKVNHSLARRAAHTAVNCSLVWIHCWGSNHNPQWYVWLGSIASQYQTLVPTTIPSCGWCHSWVLRSKSHCCLVMLYVILPKTHQLMTITALLVMRRGLIMLSWSYRLKQKEKSENCDDWLQFFFTNHSQW